MKFVNFYEFFIIVGDELSVHFGGFEDQIEKFEDQIEKIEKILIFENV